MSQSEKYSQVLEQSQILIESLGKLLVDSVSESAQLVNVLSHDGLKVAADARNMGTALLESIVTTTLSTVDAIVEESAHVSEGKA